MNNFEWLRLKRSKEKKKKKRDFFVRRGKKKTAKMYIATLEH